MNIVDTIGRAVRAGAWLAAAVVWTGEAAVHGRVVARETGGALPNAIVTLEPAGAPESSGSSAASAFTREDGGFAFTGVAEGRWRLRVRQLGFAPVDTAIVVTRDGSPQALRIELARIAIPLERVHVVGIAECTRPGVPDSASAPELFAVFDQLRENAARYSFLARSHPFEHTVERTLGRRDRAGAERVTARDTILVRSDRWTPYRPGRVVHEVVEHGERREEIRLPTLPDFADRAFQRHHCFAFAGVESVDGTPAVRIDFVPSRRIRTPDVAGSVYLDTAGYRIRRAVVRLANAPRSILGAPTVRAVADFVEVLPSILLVERVEATTTFGSDTLPRQGAFESQRMLGFRFLGSSPAGAPRR